MRIIDFSGQSIDLLLNKVMRSWSHKRLEARLLQHLQKAKRDEIFSGFQQVWLGEWK